MGTKMAFPKRNILGGRVRTTLKAQARALRKTSTPAEQRFWSIVRNGRLNGLKFRRQQQIGDWIVDFYCHEMKLIVELLGGVHSGESRDRADRVRKKNLESRGLHMIEITNEIVLRNPLQVEQDLIVALSQLPSPSPDGGGSAASAAGVGVEK